MDNTGPFRIMIRWISFLVLCTFIEPIYAAGPFKLRNDRNRCKIQMIRAGSLMVVKTFINQQGPFNFILDSGVGLMVIIDPEIKDQLNIDYLREVSITGLGSRVLKADVTPHLQVRIGAVTASSIGAVILKEREKELSAHAGMAIHGIIGYDFFSSFEVKTNYHKGQIICTATASDKKKREIRLPLEIIRKKPYCQLDIELDGDERRQIKTLIDSGGGHTLALETWGGSIFDKPEKSVSSFLGVGLGGVIYGAVGRIHQLKIGNYEIPELLCSYPDYANHPEEEFLLGRNASLGNNFLSHFEVTYNYEKKYIGFKPLYRRFPRLEFNMSGLEVIAGGKNFKKYFIGRINRSVVDPDTDFEEGDEIVSVNLKGTAEMDLEEINDILKSSKGKQLLIETRRNGVLIRNILVLNSII